LLIIAVIAAVYSNGLRGPLVFDDRATIIDNDTIEDLGNSRVLQPPHETSVAGRPVANVSFAVNYAIGGRDVVGYHAVNVAIHILCALLVFAIARQQAPPGAALALALLWGVHPLTTEAVDYLTQRTESLMALLYLATLYCAARAAVSHARWWTVAAVAACALGMATKESMVTAPVVVVLYDGVYLFASWRQALQRRRWLYAGLAATWLLLAALIWQGPRNLSAGFTSHDANAFSYALNQAVMIVRYIRLAFWPTDLVLYYGWPAVVSVRDVWPQLVLVLALVASAVWALWKRPRVGFLGVCFFITLAPTSSIVPITTEVAAERRMYLPLIALAALVILGLRKVLPRPSLRVAAVAIATVLLGARTLARNAEYGSSLRLAETTVEGWPSPAAHSMLGVELAAAGRLPEAEHHLREAVADYPPARYYLGTVLVAENRPAEAIGSFRSFIAAQPPQFEQVRLAHRELAGALAKSGLDDEAADEYRAALAADPGDTQAMRPLAQLLLAHQRFEESIPLLRQLTVARPDDAWAFGGLGVAQASTGHLDEAVDAFRRQVALDPGNDHARQNLARALSMRGR
jgi:tetratricopeptide (TPR) repeat protein